MPTSWYICIYASISGRIYAYTCRHKCVYIYIANEPANNHTIYTHIHICISVGIYAYMQGYGGAYMYTCMIRKYMDIRRNIGTYVYIYMQAYMGAWLHAADGRVNKGMNEWVDGWNNGWMIGWISEWINASMDK